MNQQPKLPVYLSLREYTAVEMLKILFQTGGTKAEKVAAAVEYADLLEVELNKSMVEAFKKFQARSEINTDV